MLLIAICIVVCCAANRQRYMYVYSKLSQSVAVSNVTTEIIYSYIKN